MTRFPGGQQPAGMGDRRGPFGQRLHWHSRVRLKSGSSAEHPAAALTCAQMVICPLLKNLYVVGFFVGGDVMGEDREIPRALVRQILI